MRSSRSSDNPVFVGLVARAVAVAAILCGLVSACGVDDAGAYDNVIGDAGTTERGRGVGRYGVSNADVSGSDIDPNDAPWLYKVSYDGLTMTPDGQHLLIGRPRPGPHLGWGKPGLQLVAYHLGTGKVADLGIANAVRVNFAPDGATGWLLAPVEPQGTELWQIDVATLKIDKMMVFPERYTSLDVSPNGQALVLGNVPRDTIGGLLNPGVASQLCPAHGASRLGQRGGQPGYCNYASRLRKPRRLDCGKEHPLADAGSPNGRMGHLGHAADQFRPLWQL